MTAGVLLLNASAPLGLVSEGSTTAVTEPR